MQKVSLLNMFEQLIETISTNTEPSKYYWKNGEGEYHEIVEVDLLRGRFITDDQDFSEYEWELKESRIYREVE